VTPRSRPAPVEMTDADIEAIVAGAIAAEAAVARGEAAPPSSAIVWWRAQMRARQEAAQLAEKPIAVVHGLAVACGAGVALSLLGIVMAGVRGSLPWLKGAYDTVAAAPVASVSALDFGSRWITLSLTVTLVSVVLVSVAALLVLADD
jgi:hypothetical protein